MGKRSSFARVERDYYRTPTIAVEPLRPYLAGILSVAEPCAGDGTLVRALLRMGIHVPFIADIEPDHPMVHCADALDLNAGDVADCHAIITNPPWDRPVLHAMIKHFSALRPTWLLFDADWVHTKQAVPYMPLLRKIVSVGRVRWIEGTKTSGKDNCAWHLFDAHSDGPAVFVGRGHADRFLGGE